MGKILLTLGTSVALIIHDKHCHGKKSYWDSKHYELKAIEDVAMS